ncbi:PREDICTED: uncharacterized protein LOC105556033 isoform X1 [Vollenhovia emeryi]|uniref:uncharacterized protein LOC105556033 isoform X1 n=1 Tax=Vollenhovia emeryi TaxID=411798 RepID=UPI0005F5019F|nr:PREDICTED: uncharacterized protein LOC105556033 isoform X1 [Vollenhovia emeryi]
MRSAPRRYSSLCSLTGKSAWTVGHRQEHARAFARHWRLAGTNEFVHMNRDEFYSTHVSVKCKSCLDKLCTVKRDLYNAVVMKCRFVSLCKFPVKALPAKACAVTRKIMKRNVEWVIREMKESECKRRRQSWNTCRNLTYNLHLSTRRSRTEPYRF